MAAGLSAGKSGPPYTPRNTLPTRAEGPIAESIIRTTATRLRQSRAQPDSLGSEQIYGQQRAQLTHCVILRARPGPCRP